MKRICFVLAVLAATMLSSCVEEKPFDEISVGENEIAFIMGNTSTRSGNAVSTAIRGVSIPIGKTAKGETIFLDETIEELNPAPATKGAPAYTVNLGTLYSDMGVYASGNFGDETFEAMDEALYDGGWRYQHRYGSDPWPEDDSPVNFYLRMPASGTGVEDLSYVENTKAVSFNLTSPLDGSNQQDLLFGQTTLTKSEHDGYLPKGAPVTMYHALTGIKFRNGHENANATKTIITKVEIKGLNQKGTCVITPGASDANVAWSDLGTNNVTFSMEFSNPDYDPDDREDNPDGTVDYTGDDSPFKGTSWVSAAADHNLNDEDGSLTFWFIPQAMTDDVVLEVTFRIKTPDTPEGQDTFETIELGTLLNEHMNGGTVTWGAGQLRTYTLRPADVDVEIVDKMTATTKYDLHIANTGNVDEYVRMLIMGNWYGWEPGTTAEQMDPNNSAYIEPSILVGYKYKTEAEAEAAGGDYKDMVPAWFRGGYNGVDPYGTFDDSFLLGSLGDRDGAPDDWADASGGYYFTSKIGPGEGTAGTPSATKDLFVSYEVTNVPTIYLPYGDKREAAVGVHLVMEIVVQAIGVPIDPETGKDVWWLQAWYNATGISNLDPTATRNAAYLAHYNAGHYDVTPSTGD